MNQENPYLPPAAVVQDALPEATVELADRGTRLVAVIIDGIAYGVLGILAAIAIPAMLVMRQRGAEGAAAGVGVAIAVLVMAIGFLAVFIWNLVWLAKYGQTIGKRAMAVRIVRQDGSRAGLGRIFWVRMVVPAIIGMVPIFGPMFSLVNICFIFRDDRRCIHDLMADTVVVKA